MKKKIILIIVGSGYFATDLIAQHIYSNISVVNDIEVIYNIPSKKELSFEDLINPFEVLTIEEIDNQFKEAILEHNFFSISNKKNFTQIKGEKAFLLLNNKSRYKAKSPVLNKNDSLYLIQIKYNSIYLFLNKERPRIRSPGYYI
jgi:protein-arginine kinase